MSTHCESAFLAVFHLDSKNILSRSDKGIFSKRGSEMAAKLIINDTIARSLGSRATISSVHFLCSECPRSNRTSDRIRFW